MQLPLIVSKHNLGGIMLSIVNMLKMKWEV